MTKQYLILVAVGILVSSCTTAPLTKEEAAEMPPLALRTEYRHYSERITATGYDRESLINRLKVIYSEIERRKIDCNSVLPPKLEQKKGAAGIVNCMPNQVTGGITCF